MNKNTKLGLTVVGVGAIAYYLFTKKKQATTKSYVGTVGDRLGADGLLARMKKAAQPYLPQVYHPENASSGPAKKKKAFADDNFLGFADGGYVNKGDMYNNNLRYGTAWVGEKKSLTGGNTFFTNQSEKLNY
jgi:hypothetical protein